MDYNYNQMNMGQMQGSASYTGQVPGQVPMDNPGVGMPPQPMGGPGMGMSPQPMGGPGMGMPPQPLMGGPGMGMPPQPPMGGPGMGMPPQPPMGGPGMGMNPQPPMGGPGMGMPPQPPMGGPGMGMNPPYPMGGPGMGIPPQPYPMGGPGMGMNPQYPMGAPMVSAPMVPYQGMQKQSNMYSKKRDETAEKRIKGMMSSVYVMALAISFSVQIVCIIVATILRVGFVGYSFLVPYILMAVTAWLIWGTAKKEKYNKAGGGLIMASAILGIVIACFIALFVGLFLFVWTFAWDDMASVADALLYNIFGIKSRFKDLGFASVLVANIMFIAPIVLFIILQAKLIGFRRVINRTVDRQIDEIPKTKFIAVLLFIFAACSIAVVVFYFNILSRAIVLAGFVFFGVFLVLNVFMFGLMGYIMLRIGRKKTEEEEVTYR